MSLRIEVTTRSGLSDRVFSALRPSEIDDRGQVLGLVQFFLGRVLLVVVEQADQRNPEVEELIADEPARDDALRGHRCLHIAEEGRP